MAKIQHGEHFFKHALTMIVGAHLQAKTPGHKVVMRFSGFEINGKTLPDEIASKLKFVVVVDEEPIRAEADDYAEYEYPQAFEVIAPATPEITVQPKTGNGNGKKSRTVVNREEE